MPTPKYSLPYSKSTIEFDLPAGMEATVAESQQAEPVKDIPGAIRAALDHPVGSAPLRKLASPGKRACILFTDITRSSPDNLLVPALLG
jgi:nickel-dependent lactate racemase